MLEDLRTHSNIIPNTRKTNILSKQTKRRSGSAPTGKAKQVVVYAIGQKKTTLVLFDRWIELVYVDQLHPPTSAQNQKDLYYLLNRKTRSR
jgi:hypothetical protein